MCLKEIMQPNITRRETDNTSPPHPQTPHTYQFRDTHRHLLKGQRDTEKYYYGWRGRQPQHVCLQDNAPKILQVPSCIFTAEDMNGNISIWCLPFWLDDIKLGECLACGLKVFTPAVKAVCVQSHRKQHTCRTVFKPKLHKNKTCLYP